MKTKTTLAALILLATLPITFLTVGANDNDEDRVTCGNEICVVEDAKNKFLRKGCKTKEGHFCQLNGGGGIKLPKIFV